MILKIQKSKSLRLIAVFLLLNISAEIIAPTAALALTGGPAQPEFGSFTPVGVSDMVDLSSGDLNYNIPLMDVGGYPLNIAYSSGIAMDDEASWVGLGWNLSVGQINRNVRGLPDDFDGDLMTYENNMKPNVTVGASFKLSPDVFGVELPIGSGNGQGSVSVGVTAMYNNYSGFTLKQSVGVQMDLSKNCSVGFNADNGPDGLAISPSLSIHSNSDAKDRKNKDLCGTVGVTMNSRQGLTSMSLSASKKSTGKAAKNATDKVKEEMAATKGSSSVGSSIGFTDELYTPSKRTAMNTQSFTVNVSFGTEVFGAEAQGHITAFGTIQSIDPSELYKQRKAYGYANSHHSDKYGILDFNREKDGSVNVNTTNLPLTNYTYDIYSVQGQGVGGTYRPFRGQVGYVFDSYVTDGSTSNSLGVEVGGGNALHNGIDFENTSISSHSGLWSSGNSFLQFLTETDNTNMKYEQVYYKNVGDLSIDQDFQMFDQTGKYTAMRIPFIGNKFYRTLSNQMSYKYDSSAEEYGLGGSVIKRTQRKSRNQAIQNITIKQLKEGVGYGPCVKRNASNPEVTLPVYAKDHHTGEVQIIRNDGARYIYGLPLYNKVKKEVSFSVQKPNNNNVNNQKGIISYSPGQDNSVNNNINNKNFNRTTTPPYAHTYLLTSVLSTDYQDLTNDGPSDDDLGSYTKFSYVNKQGSIYKWRVPFQENCATYNPGLNTDSDDDDANYVYGEKEQMYIDKIETKTHIAYFDLSTRQDAKGVLGENGGLDVNANSFKLDRIRLFSKAEIKATQLKNPGLSLSQILNLVAPIKTVNFEYSYSLCPGVPNNGGAVTNELNNKGGKLTLKKIYFTYRESKMGKYTGYTFNYNEYADGKDEYTGGNLIIGNNNDNPSYDVKGYDSWGNFKPSNATSNLFNSDPVTAAEYPFTEQNKVIQDERASVWCLKSIKTPSGGTITVQYESDDYAYVQNKKPLQMYKVVGAGTTSTPGSLPNGVTGELFSSSMNNDPNTYFYVQIPDNVDISDLNTPSAIKNHFFSNLEQGLIQFRFYVNMTQAGGTSTAVNSVAYDYVSGYANINNESPVSIFPFAGHNYLSVPIKKVEREGPIFKEVNPVSKAAWSFGRKYLSKQVYGTSPTGNSTDIEDIARQMVSPGILSNLKEIFKGPNTTLENKFIGRQFIKDKSWIRLNTASKNKLGGGCRVKTVRISDVWGSEDPNNSMNPTASNYKTMNYGIQYNYNLSDDETNELSKMSSGVATYEPVGNKENPFVMPVVATTKHLLAPKDENYIEKPFGESFFPSPQITYARVSVSNISGALSLPTDTRVKKMHRTGKVVNEFYTSKDYPTIVDQTKMQAKEDKKSNLASLLKIKMKKHFTASQGYVIHLNDMNGKQKANWVYAEGQDKPISGVSYHYASDDYFASNGGEHNRGKLNNNVPVVFPNGDIKNKVIGVEYDIVHDLRENGSETQIAGVNTNLASFFVGIIPGLVPIPLPDMSSSEDQFRSVSTTKVVNTFGILAETIAYDGDTKVYTRNIGWDAITGEVIATETVDEYNDKYYTFNYPAHWFYKGMSQASINLGMEGTMTASGGGYTLVGLSSGSMASDFLIPGDEIIIGSPDANGIRKKAWISYVLGNQFKLIDEVGTAITSSTYNGKFTVIRSGRRNLQSAGIMNVTLMRNPLKNTSGGLISNLGTSFLLGTSWEQWKIINAGAVDYSDNWLGSCECGIVGNNPYIKNELGVWRVKSSRTYLTGRNSHNEVTPRLDGFFSNFSPMYKLTLGHTWYKDFSNWTFVSEVSRYSPYGFELENRDALDRYSGAVYGYNNTLPIAVGANAKYTELGYDGFEDRGFVGCNVNSHFVFPGTFEGTGNGAIIRSESHTGLYSIKVSPNSQVTLNKKLSCPQP